MKLTEYISKNNLNDYFNMICIDDNITKVPSNITVVPTIIDEDVEAPLEGKKAFEYVINQKYFNHPTNNTEFTKNGVPKPTIEEDKKAITSKSGSGFIFVTDENTIERDERSNFDKVFNLNKELQLQAQQQSNVSSSQQQSYSSSQQQQTYSGSQQQQTYSGSQQSYTSSSQQKLLLTRQQFQQQLQPKPQPVQPKPQPPPVQPKPQPQPVQPKPQPPPVQPKPPVQQKKIDDSKMEDLLRLRGRR